MGGKKILLFSGKDQQICFTMLHLFQCYSLQNYVTNVDSSEYIFLTWSFSLRKMKKVIFSCSTRATQMNFCHSIWCSKWERCQKDRLVKKRNIYSKCKEGVWVKYEVFLFTEDCAFRSYCVLVMLHLSAYRTVQVGKRPLWCPTRTLQVC